jgi:hypothetical protein
MSHEGNQRQNRLESGWPWVLLSLLWGVAVFIAYYVVHKPVDLGLVIALARLALIILGWIGTLALAHLIGRLLTPLLKDMPIRPSLAFRIGFGLAVLGYFVLALGAVQGYWPLLAWIVTAIALPFGLPSLLSDIRAALPRIPSTRANQALAAFVLFALLMAFLLALAPPTAWDSLVYHLTGPKLYIEAGGLNHDIDLPYLGFPQAGSMMFLWAEMLAGAELAQLIHLTFAILTLMLMAHVVKELSQGNGWLPVALILGVPTAAMLASWAYVEWITMFGVLASFILIRSREPGIPEGKGHLFRGYRALALAGFFAAMSINTKYTAIGALLGLIVVAFIERRSWRGLGVFIAAIAVSILPYMLKNLLLTGNPVYPFFLSGVFWDSHRAYWYSRGGTGLSLMQMLLAPWEATIFGIEGGVVAGHPPYSATIGPALLALLPLAALRFKDRSERARRLMRSMAVVCAIGTIVWLGQMAFSELMVQTRLLFPILPMIVILAAAGFDGLAKRGRLSDLARLAFGTLIGLMLALGVLEAGAAFVDASPASVLFGTQTKSEYLAQRLGDFAFAMAEVNQLAEGSQVRFLWEPRSYYCARHVVCEPDALLDRWWHTWQHEADVAQIAESWIQEGVTHVLIFHTGSQAVREAGFDPMMEETWDGLAVFVDAHLFRLTVREGAYTLYALIR